MDAVANEHNENIPEMYTIINARRHKHAQHSSTTHFNQSSFRLDGSSQLRAIRRKTSNTFLLFFAYAAVRGSIVANDANNPEAEKKQIMSSIKPRAS